MVDIKNVLKQFFLYHEDDSNYHFMLPEANNENKQNLNDSPSNIIDNVSVFPKLADNYTHLQVKYNSLINSDIILRKFQIIAKGKKYPAFILCIDGMIDSDLLNNYLLKPLMKLNKPIDLKSSKLSCNVNIKKTDKTSLEDYIYQNLIPQNSIKTSTDFQDILSSVNMGDCALFVDTLPIGFIIDVKGFSARSVSSPNNEIVVKGAQEAFVEKLRTNTSMLRRIINSENLVIENTKVGTVSKTSVAICYMKNIVNSELISEVKYRINNLNIDYILSSGQLEQLIQDNSKIAFPQMVATERPDKAAHHIFEGRVVILVNGSPYSLIAPAVFTDFLSSPEDINLKHQYSNLLRIIRILAILITLFLPGFYVSISNYHTELLPTELLFTIAESRNAVPFPVIFEIIIMEVAFELIREAGLRIPTPIGPTIGIIGALVLGEAAVSANLVSPVLIIIVATTGICSFSIPDFSLSFTFRIFKFMYIFLGYIAGFVGISIGIFIQLSMLASLKSFGVSYLSPYVPTTSLNTSISYFMKPIWKREKRADFLNTKRPKEEHKISMKWKFWNS